MNNDIKQELGFVYILNGKKFVSKKEAIKYNILTSLINLLGYITILLYG